MFIKSITSSKPLDFKNLNQFDLHTKKKHVNDFKNKPKLFYSNSEIFLADISVTGNFYIQSATKISVDASANLTDVILVAPEVEIKNNVKGTFQVFATKNIVVAERVILKYPSTLVLQSDYQQQQQQSNKNSNKNSIVVADHSEVQGNILVLGKTQANNYDEQIKIYPSAIIKGSIYCEQNLELRGTVYGTVYTDNFIIKEAGSTYQNHLFNAIINSKKLEPEYIGLPFEESSKGIAKWLY